MNTNDAPDRLPNPKRRFTQMYLDGHTPWDSGISPPELLAAIEGPGALPPGRALDVGCGTGTNSLTLALMGWRVVGVDFAAPAIARAQAKATQVQAQVAQGSGSVTFMCGDVTQLAPPSAEEQMQLILDIGCLNGIPHELRGAYAQVMAQQAAPDALFLLYAHLPPPNDPDGSDDSTRSGPLGCTPDELDALFSESFVLAQRVLGQAPQGGESMWNWWKRRV